MPGRRNGVVTSTSAAARTAASRPARVARWGPISTTKPAGNAASSPSSAGSLSAPPATAPSRVPAFQHTKMASPEVQKARTWLARSGCAVAIAVDSSMTSCDASSRRPSDPRRIGASARPYTPLRAARSRPLATAAGPLPPPARTPTAANCDAPVNTRSEMAMAWGTVSPLATASTPNETPTRPTATPSASEAVTTARPLGTSVTWRGSRARSLRVAGR